MAQAFITSYKNDYRWNNQPRVLPIYQENLNKLEITGDDWLINTGIYDDEEFSNLEKAEAAIHKMLLKRMRSTYKVSYCKQDLEKESIKDVKSVAEVEAKKSHIGQEKCLENELLEQSKLLYEKIPRKMLPPLDTGRTVFGYIRPARLRVPFTTYQNEFGKVAYDILKENSAKNKCTNLGDC